MTSYREDGSDVVLSVKGKVFSSIDGERPIRTPAKDMCVMPADMPPRWSEMKVSVLEQPKFGQRDYAVRRFVLSDDGKEEALASFEVVVYNDHQTAARVFASTLSKMGFLRLTKLDLADMAAVIEVPGRPTRRLRALIFAERNVMGLIMVSTISDRYASDSWLISMGRLMVSRTA
mgnify:CR=1 FL=1